MGGGSSSGSTSSIQTWDKTCQKCGVLVIVVPLGPEVRPQALFIWSTEPPLSIMKVSIFGDGLLHSTVLNIKGHSLEIAKGNSAFACCNNSSGCCDSEQSARPGDFCYGVCMLCFFLLGVGRSYYFFSIVVGMRYTMLDRLER